MTQITHRALATALVFSALITTAPAQTTHDITLVMEPTSIEIEPGKVVTNSWLFNGQLPGPAIRVTEGDTIRAKIVNRLPEHTTVHWHGLPVPLEADGVAGRSQWPIGVGQEYTYEFVAGTPGTYWYHPHIDLQIDRGLVAPLIVEPANPASDPPFDREYVIVLDDWLPGAPIPGQNPFYSDYLINGRTSLGQTPLNVIAGETVRLRVLNAAGNTNFVFALDGHSMLVTHTDGQPVVPVSAQAIPIGVGERYDVYVTADNPGRWSFAVADLLNRTQPLVRAIFAYQGSPGPDPLPAYVPAALSSAPLLTYAQLASAEPLGPIATTPDRTYPIDLSKGTGYVWLINGQAFPNASPIDVALGETVRFETTNLTYHPHPMHIHGHFFRLLGSGGGTSAPLVKDTVLLMPSSGSNFTRIDMELVADNPGDWPYHCHMIYHMSAGMMRLVRYVGSDSDNDGLSDGEDFDPFSDRPVSGLGGLGNGFVPGFAMEVYAQWPAGETVAWLVGAPRLVPIALPPLGSIDVDPMIWFGSAVANANRVATLALTLPPDPGIRGYRIGFQGVATAFSLPGSFRISELARLIIQ